jgi:hypothetical protein
MQAHIEFLQMESAFYAKERELIEQLSVIRHSMFERMYTNIEQHQKEFDSCYESIIENRKHYERQTQTFEAQKIVVCQDRRGIIRGMQQVEFDYDASGGNGAKTHCCS